MKLALIFVSTIAVIITQRIDDPTDKHWMPTCSPRLVPTQEPTFNNNEDKNFYDYLDYGDNELPESVQLEPESTPLLIYFTV